MPAVRENRLSDYKAEMARGSSESQEGVTEASDQHDQSRPPGRP